MMRGLGVCVVTELHLEDQEKKTLFPAKNQEILHLSLYTVIVTKVPGGTKSQINRRLPVENVFIT